MSSKFSFFTHLNVELKISFFQNFFSCDVDFVAKDIWMFVLTSVPQIFYFLN